MVKPLVKKVMSVVCAGAILFPMGDTFAGNDNNFPKSPLKSDSKDESSKIPSNEVDSEASTEIDEEKEEKPPVLAKPDDNCFIQYKNNNKVRICLKGSVIPNSSASRKIATDDVVPLSDNEDEPESTKPKEIPALLNFTVGKNILEKLKKISDEKIIKNNDGYLKLEESRPCATLNPIEKYAPPKEEKKPHINEEDALKAPIADRIKKKTLSKKDSLFDNTPLATRRKKRLTHHKKSAKENGEVLPVDKCEKNPELKPSDSKVQDNKQATILNDEKCREDIEKLSPEDKKKVEYNCVLYDQLLIEINKVHQEIHEDKYTAEIVQKLYNVLVEDKSYFCKPGNFIDICYDAIFDHFVPEVDACLKTMLPEQPRWIIVVTKEKVLPGCTRNKELDSIVDFMDCTRILINRENKNANLESVERLLVKYTLPEHIDKTRKEINGRMYVFLGKVTEGKHKDKFVIFVKEGPTARLLIV